MTLRALNLAYACHTKRGDVDSCGDWLTVPFKDAFRTKDGGLDLVAFRACLKDDKIAEPKVNMDRHGAIGQFPMCAGLIFRPHTLKVGHMVIGGKKIAAPGAKRRRRKA